MYLKKFSNSTKAAITGGIFIIIASIISAIYGFYKKFKQQ